MPSRERLLIVGDVGTGKTKALFALAHKALAAGKKVFLFVYDDGHQRFMNKDWVIKYVTENKFFVNSVVTWPDARKAYKEAKLLWEPGDWVMADRLDLMWDEIQAYFKAQTLNIDRDDLPDYNLRVTLADENDVQIKDTDWDVQKSAIRSLIFDPNAGPDAVRMGINVAMTSWAVPGITARMVNKGGSKVEEESSKNDPRKLRELNTTVQGEKHVPGWFDTVLVFKIVPRGYVMSSYKDRERKLISEVLIGDDFADTYQSEVGVRF